jgi:hypothetical protein
MTKEKGRIGFWDYTLPDRKMTDVERAVDFLLWAARVMPGRAVPVEQIVRVALNLPKLPREEANTIKTFKNRLTVVKRMLFDGHQCHLLYHPGAGYRCTISSEDAARTHQEIQTRRVAGAIRGLARSRSIIKRSELKPITQQRYDVIGVIEKKLLAPSLYDHLLAPDAPEAPEVDDKKKK